MATPETQTQGTPLDGPQGTPGAETPVTPTDLPRASDLSGRRWFPPAVYLAVGLLLFIAYLWQARTVAMNSDGASNALQAWDMLHGNVLLRGWSLSDVSWYTTELPEYMLVELARGLNSDVGHIAAALTYTLVVLLAALVAKGQATGRPAALRAVVATGIMLTPSLGRGTHVLLTRPDHLGTQVVLLAVWLLIDRAKPRWRVPVAVAMLLAWAQVADTLVLYEGVLPLLIVCGVRVYRHHGPLRERSYELALAAAGVISAILATVALVVIRDVGGFAMRMPSTWFTDASALPTHLWVSIETVLTIFGADFFGLKLTTVVAIAALLHLTGVVLASFALARALRRFPAQDLMVQLTAVAIVVLLAAYLLGPKTNSLTGAYEIAGVLPLSAVLAGRMLAGRLPGSRLGPILAVVLVCYAGLLVGHAGHRHAFSENQRVAIWLRAHHLSYGLAWYWHANVVTADSGNQVQVRPVAARGYTLVLNHIQSQASWYDPRLHYANFVIAPGKLSVCVPRARRWCPWAAAFGQPTRAYQVGNLVVMVWDKNLLDTHFEQGPPIPPPSIAAGRGDGRVPGIVG